MGFRSDGLLRRAQREPHQTDGLCEKGAMGRRYDSGSKHWTHRPRRGCSRGSHDGTLGDRLEAASSRFRYAYQVTTPGVHADVHHRFSSGHGNRDVPLKRMTNSAAILESGRGNNYQFQDWVTEIQNTKKIEVLRRVRIEKLSQNRARVFK